MNEQEELAHLTAPSNDPKQRMIDYWGKRCEKAEAEIERLTAALQQAQQWASAAADALQPSAEENMRLKAAVRAMMDETDMDAMIVIARAALARREGK